MTPRFEVLETLESHQRASLIKARDLGTGQEVLLRRYRGDREEIEAQRELLNTIKALGHPNLEQVLEVGTDDEGLFAVVGQLDGMTLAGLLKQGPLSEPEFEQVARQVLAGLTALHERGLPHLSLRPEVIHVRRPAAGLLDVRVGGFGEGFGRKSESEPAEPAAYRCTAPEQWRGDPVGRRTDIYATGCIFYESLAGKPPFRPDSINGLRAAHLGHDFVPLQREAPQVKAWISAWVTKLLDPDINTRPKDAAAALKLFNLRDHLLPPDQSQPQGLPPGYGTHVPYAMPAHPMPSAPHGSGMVPLTRTVMPAASSTTAFQPVPLAHKTQGVQPRSEPRRAAPHVPVAPTSKQAQRSRLVLVAVGVLVVGGAAALLLLLPSKKPSMAPVAQRLAMRLPVTSGLLLHLDAGRHDTLDTSITNRVRKWSDAEDKTRYAAPPAVEDGPALSVANLNELPILDFGPYHSDHWMEFKDAKGATRRLSSIRTVFWVVRGPGFLLCDDQLFDFARGGSEGSPDAGIIGGAASDPVKHGTLRLNGAAVKTVDTPMPQDFALITLVTSGPATASRLCKDRTSDRTGGQQLAELVIYDRALNEAEVKQVETYLRTKWLSP